MKYYFKAISTNTADSKTGLMFILDDCQYLFNVPDSFARMAQIDHTNFFKTKYVFIPFQKSNDISLINYSKHGMFEFAKTVVKFCKERDIPVVMKIHPHVNGQERNKSRNCFNEMKKIHSKCYLINTSIYDLIRNARFTACLNSGSLIDNFVTQTPVLS